jgi:hypothetical protein
MDDLTDLKNHWVRFKLRDVFVPPAETILEQLHAGDVLQGRVVGTTRRGVEQDIYVVIDVQGLKTAVVVPLAQVSRIP